MIDDRIKILQVLSDPDPDFVQAQVRQYALIFVGVGVFSGITNFIMVKIKY